LIGIINAGLCQLVANIKSDSPQSVRPGDRFLVHIRHWNTKYNANSGCIQEGEEKLVSTCKKGKKGTVNIFFFLLLVDV